MSKKQPRNTKGKIISAAWKLFYEQGYDDTTIDEIIAESGTSKGTFYPVPYTHLTMPTTFSA